MYASGSLDSEAEILILKTENILDDDQIVMPIKINPGHMMWVITEILLIFRLSQAFENTWIGELLQYLVAQNLLDKI